MTFPKYVYFTESTHFHKLGNIESS